MRKWYVLAAMALVLVMLTGCLAGPNEAAKTASEEGRVAGFWLGLWHGLLAPITFIISLFSRNVHFYEVHNNGNWYNFGFVLGAGLLFSGGIFGRGSRKKD